MKRLFILLSFILFCKCTNAQVADGKSLQELSTSTFISLPVPQHFDGQLFLIKDDKTIEQKKISDVKHDNTLLSSLPNIVSSVTVYQVDEDGSLTLLGNSISAKKSVYEVIYDFTQTQSIELPDGTFALVGISVRMVAKVRTTSSGINLSSIEGLGIAASRKKVSGSLEVRTVGIGSLKINAVIPVTTDLSPASISNALQSVATIKSHIYDTETVITPQFLAVTKGLGNKNDTSKAIQANLDKIINPLFKAQYQQQVQ